MAIQRSRSGKRMVLSKSLVGSVIILFVTASACTDAKTADYKVSSVPGGTPDPELVKELFNTKCGICHGQDGKMNYAGAKDLTLTSMTKEEIITQIKFGKGSMPPQKGVLDDEQIAALADYTLSLPK